MITRFGFAPRKPGLSCSEFRTHWQDVHGPIIRDMPGLRGYRQNHRSDSYMIGEIHYDALAETDFDSLAAMEASFQSSYYRESVMPDEGRFVLRDQGFAILTAAPDDRLRDRGLRHMLLLRKGRDEGLLGRLEATPGAASIYYVLSEQISEQARDVLAIAIGGDKDESSLLAGAVGVITADCVVIV